MITLDEAKALKPGDILIDQFGKRWKVNGQVQRWKRSPDDIYVPLKHGLYAYDRLTHLDFNEDKECNLLTLEGSLTV